jgi:hypothetical protein
MIITERNENEMETQNNEIHARYQKVYLEDKTLIHPNREIIELGHNIFTIIEYNIRCPSKDKKKYKSYLIFKLHNLIMADSVGVNLIYSRDRNNYIKKYCCEENKPFWERCVVTTVSDLLESNFYIKQIIGKFNLYNQNRHMTIVEIRPKLRQLISIIRLQNIERSEKIEQIELRNKKTIKLKNGNEVTIKNSVCYKDTDHERIPIMRRELSEIYQFYKQQDLGGFLPDQVSAEHPELIKLLKQYHRTGRIKMIRYPDGCYFTILDRMVRRIFNDGKFLHGGRVYAFWQNIPRKLRKYLLINGSPVAELDYSACQIRLLYHAMLQQDYKGGCPYSLPGVSRDLSKKAAIITLNAKKDKSAVFALIGAAAKDLGQHISYSEAKRCIDLFKEKHRPIADYFNSGAGVILMRIESEVIVRTILAMMRKGICVLTIHDSCIFPIQYKAEVYDAMINEYQSLLNHLPSVKLDQ